MSRKPLEHLLTLHALNNADHLLSAFADSFYGYGDYAAPYWFIGMEEGGGDTTEEIGRRLSVWDERGRQELEDLPSYSGLVGAGKWFETRPPLQSTWAKLIRLLLSSEGQAATTEEVRTFQRDVLGRTNGVTALLELLPLPSPSTSKWLYAEHSSLPQLSDRATYMEHYAAQRAEWIRRRVREHRPRIVVFYGKAYRRWWERIVGQPFVEGGGLGALWADDGRTTFLLMSHPVATGVTNAEFERLGASIART